MTFLNVHRPWNSVDIQDADGLMYHGRVIDCVEEGLVVNDLGCETPQLILFGRIYRFPDFHPSDVIELERMPVEALMRLQMKEPARWYRGTFLAGEVGCLGSFGLVLVTTPKSTSMEVLRGACIREQRTNAEAVRFLVAKGQFVKQEVPLPSGISSGSPSPGPYQTSTADQHLVDYFNRSNSGVQMLATHIDGDILHVLKGTDHFSSNRCTMGPKLEGETLLRMLGLGEKPREYLGTDGGTVMLSTVDALDTMKPERISDYLPVDLLAEIFSYLDCLEQVRLRRVCPNWKSILTAYPVTRTLFVGVPNDKATSSAARIRSLCEQWTAQTAIITNTSCTTGKSNDVGSYLKDEYQPLLCSGRLFRCIMQEHQFPQLKSIILANVTWNWRRPVRERGPHFSCMISHICEELNSFASLCHSLLLQNVTVGLLKDGKVTASNGFLTMKRDTPVIVHISEGRIIGKLAVETMWNMMEDNLPQLSSADLDRLREMIRGATNDLIKELLEVLMGCQSGDPRSGNQFRNKQWTAEDLPVLAPIKLNQISLHSILKVSRHEQLILSFGW